MLIPRRVLAAILLVAAPALAQQVPFVPITGTNAPRTAVTFLEDSRGGLWLGGAEAGGEGLTYFDGSRFVRIENAPKSLVAGMAEDSEGGIWIASRIGLHRYWKGRFSQFVSGIDLAAITKIDPNTFLTEIRMPGTNDSADVDLVRVMKVAGQWQADSLGKVVSGVEYRPNRAGTVLYPCREGVCEILSADVRSWRPGSTLPVKRRPLPVHTTDGIVITDRFGCLWMRSRLDAMYQCPGDSRATVLPTSAVSVGPVTILELDDGSIAIPSQAEMFVGRPGKFQVITPANGYPGGDAMLGRDGRIWFGSSKGMYVFSARDKTEFWTERDGLQGPTWSILRIGKRTVAIAGNQIQILSEDRSHWQFLSEFSSALSLLAGPEGTIFVSSLRNGIEQISASGAVLRKSEITPAAKLVRAPDGQVWATGGTLAKIVVDGQRVLLQPAKMPWPQRYAEDAKADGEGSLWACSDSGLMHLDKGSWRLISTADGLLGSRCLSFAIDSEKEVWYSYSRVGSLSLIQNPTAAKPLIRHYSNGGEVGTAQSFFLESDKRGWIWRGSGDGIYVAEPKQAREGQWLHFGMADGLPSNDSNQFAFFEDTDGSVWFGAGTTVAHWLPPADLTRPSYAPSVFVSGFSWNKGPFQMADLVDNVQYGSDVVAHIGSLQFDRRNSMRFRYRVLPEQTHWTAERNLDISLGKLSWGKHTLEVQARLYTGPWSGTSSKSLTILRPIWLSWPAALGLVAAGGVAVAGRRRWQQRRKQREEMVLPSLAGLRLAAITPDTALTDGALLDGRFEVGKELALGGFATVFEGRDLERGRACAIKVFREELLDKDWMAKRFQQEVSALEQIQHVNVVQIYGHGITLGHAPYLAMELIEGSTLRALLAHGDLDRPRVASYLRQTGSALSAIHARRIFHRDLKPENLMIRSASVPGQDLVLIDFSVAIVRDPDETMHRLSRAVGTLQYMAPEQAIGYADESSDIYSLAKVLIEMLTGKRVSTLLPNASIDLPGRVREFFDATPLGLSPASIDLIAGALEFDPARRKRDAMEFAVKIARDLDD